MQNKSQSKESMNQLCIYHIIALKKFFIENFGPNYPTEIVRLIVMINYRPIKISCGHSLTTLIDFDKIYILGDPEYQKNISQNFDIKTISCGWRHMIATSISTPNKLYVYGWNRYGQLGLKKHDENQNSIQELILCSDIESVKCGESHTIALLKSTKCYVWGRNQCGQLGLGHKTSISTPQELNLYGEYITLVECGEFYTIALTNENKCYVWGDNNCGQLGLGHHTNQNIPQELEELRLLNIISISCGGYHIAVLTTSGKIYIWGSQS